LSDPNEAIMTHPTTTPRPRAYWLCWAITSLNALVSAGYSAAALLGQGTTDVYTQYAASRSIALVVIILALGWFRSTGALLALATVMTLIQLGDAVIGFSIHDTAKSFGPLGLGLVTLLAVGVLARSFRPPRS